MAKGAKGFRKLRNKFVISVNDRACNVVRLTLADGTKYEIEATVEHGFIPVLTMTEVKKEKKHA